MSSMTDNTNMDTHRQTTRLGIPVLGTFYGRFAQPFAWVALRLAVGAVLAYEGWVKMGNPMAMAGFVESLSFYPGWFWSPLLALVNLVGGLCIMAGLLTRPWALANTVMLGVTLWFHYTHPYGPSFLTEAGMALLASPEGAQYFTADALRRLADGGTGFLAQVQDKAIFASLFWTGAVGIFAAFGGGAWSVDRRLGWEL